MSRFIKFRFWSGTKMFYGVEQVMACLVQQMSFDAGLKFPLPYDHVGLHGAYFMQFTGLLDKNGKEIYEGDILLEGNFKFMITWDCTWAKFKIQSIHHHQYPEFNRGIRMQIIGNIHQNPELL